MVDNVDKRNRFALNVERNEKLYRLWKEGKRIREAAKLTGYPEGSVSHYWNKFNRAARKGEPVVIGNPSESKPPPTKDELFASYLAKEITIAGLFRDLPTLDPLKRMEFFQKLPLMDIYPTKEEMSVYQERLPAAQLSAEILRNVTQSNSLNRSPTGAPDSVSSTDAEAAKKNEFKIEEFLPHWETDSSGNEFLMKPFPELYEFLEKYQREHIVIGDFRVAKYRDASYEYFLNDSGVVFRWKLLDENGSDKQQRVRHTIQVPSAADEATISKDSAAEESENSPAEVLPTRESPTVISEAASSEKMTRQTAKEPTSSTRSSPVEPSLPIYEPEEEKKVPQKKRQEF